MYTNQLIVKGGYGEHGRSCFIVPHGGDRYYMMDCGILDTDPEPYPEVEHEILEKTDYLFLTHCHKDHSGAFLKLVSEGFRGYLVTSEPTLKLAGIHYDKVILADPFRREPVELGREDILSAGADHTEISAQNAALNFICGRSGHCTGGVWFKIWDSSMSCLYSGDFQRRPLAYGVDEISGQTADLAIIDCAHPDTLNHADAMRRELLEAIEAGLKEHGRVILPLPKYGRGLELIVLLGKMLPKARIAADREFARNAENLLSYEKWLWPQAVTAVRDFLKTGPCDQLEKDEYEILLLGDTHLEGEECRRLVRQETDRGALVISTGRMKNSGFVKTLLDEKKAVRRSYPHHQSMGDFMETVGKNTFRTALPFHNGRKELYFG